MRNAEEKRWHLDRFQRAALYWNNLANQQVFELNKQLLVFATILLPLTASIVVVDTIQLSGSEITLLIFGWISLFVSIILGLIQIWIDARYFNYVSNDSSSRERLWSQDKDNNEIKKEVEQLGSIKPSSSTKPTILQTLFVFSGLLAIMLDAVSILRQSTPTKQEGIVSKLKSACKEQLISQSNNVVVEFDGIPSSVDFTTLPEAKTYYTMITKSVASGSNFAGHFTLAHWGCGTDCFQYAIVDTKTGEIVAYSSANVNYHLGEYGLDSKVLVLEPVYAGQERKYYKIVEGQGKSRLELVCTEISSEDMYGLPE